VRRGAARIVAAALVLSTGPSALAGCEVLLGLGGESAGGEAGADATRSGDASAERREAEAARPGGAAVVVASGTDSSDWCVVTVSGDVQCWGNNESGELGDGTTTASATPVPVKGLPGPAASVSLGIASACALLRSGAVYCWGVGIHGQLGNGTNEKFSKTPVLVTGLGGDVTAISAGNGSACAVRAGAVLCWGLGGNGLLGTGESTDSLVPKPVPGLESGVTSVSVGGYAACAVKGGGLLCWGGLDNNGELGNNTTLGSPTPVAVPSLTSGVRDVSVGDDFVCALTLSGGVMCWGDGTKGTLGNGELALSPVPVQVKGLASGVVELSTGESSVSAIRSDGTVLTWGYAGDGELGNGSAESDSGVGGGAGGASSVPVEVKGLTSPATSISTGLAPCVATRAGTVECWGVIAEDALTPVPVTGLVGVTTLTTGGNLSTGLFACATEVAGPAYCWGGNGHGQLGNGTVTSSAIPVENASLTVGSTAVSGGTDGDFACAITFGIAYCWGSNHSGQLGNNTRESSLMPVAVEGLTSGVVGIAAGQASACALTMTGADASAGGAVSCWGDNTYGQLGNGSTTSSPVPVPVTGLASGVLALSMGVSSVCALISDGTVECWGLNENGQLGDGTKTTRLVPTPVKGLVRATAVGVGWYTACAVADGRVQCWGDGTYGELGDNTFMSSLVPVPVTFINAGATQVSVGVTSACAAVAGGAWCWGIGPLGEDLAPGIANAYAAPVSNLDGVTSVAVGNEFACALAGAIVQCWGYNTAGELGNGGAVDAFLATPVAGFP
jgi:alpha-tubulin suppressor-like RCC1 family protein